jgi:hypothetical protein
MLLRANSERLAAPQVPSAAPQVPFAAPQVPFAAPQVPFKMKVSGRIIH